MGPKEILELCEKENIKVEVNKGVLTLSGERKEEKEDKKAL